LGASSSTFFLSLFYLISYNGTMHPRAAELIQRLDLKPHPEGGHFREVFRSADGVNPADGRGGRPALTTIYFLLAEGDRSRWHRVRSDEIWHYYEGGPIELAWIDRDLERCEQMRLGPVDAGSEPVAVIPAGCWQAARPLGAYTLVGCSVAPGFEFADFHLLANCPAEAAEILRRFPAAAPLI
jgi:predicted cupin superfamily sugar epimerase